MSILSTGCVSSTLAVLYICFGAFNFYKIMNPLFLLDVSEFDGKEILHPYWSTSTSTGEDNTRNKEYHQIKVYLSTKKRPDMLLLLSADDNTDISGGGDGNREKVVLLWDDIVPIESTTTNDDDDGGTTTKPVEINKELVLSIGDPNDAANMKNIVLNESIAKKWFHDKSSEDLFENSFIVTGFRSIRSFFFGLSNSLHDSKDDESDIMDMDESNVIRLSEDGPIWESLIYKNSTVYIHALVIRHLTPTPPTHTTKTLSERLQDIQKDHKSHSLLTGEVDMVKFDEAIPIKPNRILYKDLEYLFQRYVLGQTHLFPPWEFSKTQSVKFEEYQTLLHHKKNHVLHPYWKPEVSIRLIPDQTSYPYPLLQQSSYPIIKLNTPQRHKQHISGYSYLPPLHVDEIGLTSEKYIPLNTTITALPIKLTFDSHSLTPQRWRLLSHMSQSLESQKSLGLENEDIDEFRRLIADTNISLLSIIILASILHLLFEFLTFKNDVQFWKDNTDVTGLSIRALFVDFISQFIILLYLIEKDSSMLVSVPAGIGVLIALWKCRRGAGLTLVWSGKGWCFGYELQATRLQSTTSTSNEDGNKNNSNEKKDFKTDVAQLSIDMDKVATNTLTKFLIPPLLAYSLHSLINTPYTSWYSYLITTTSTFVYGLGFIFMTPQLFLNYKLKSVAHLPWKVLVYKFLNTFIDDLFALVIRMPTMAKIGVFRDDIVFFIYLGQRWCYDVDERRPVEGGGAGISKEEDSDKRKVE